MIVTKKILGWKVTYLKDLPKKSVLILYPHTSNLDFLISIIAKSLTPIKTRILVKSELSHPIINKLFNIVPVNRSQRSDMTAYLAQKLNQEAFSLAITPEGTRSYVSKWKRGFYYIALRADVPIGLVHIDYKNKTYGVEKFIHPSGDLEKDFAKIKAYYQTKGHGLYPKHMGELNITK